jgi:hypothetical protein
MEDHPITFMRIGILEQDQEFVCGQRVPSPLSWQEVYDRASVDIKTSRKLADELISSGHIARSVLPLFL